MPDRPLISVVMATYNRADILPATVECLQRQTLADDEFEVIIIDDGSPDNTREVVADLQSRVRFELTYLHHDNRGPGYTQNRGLRKARAEVGLLIADDIMLIPTALEAHLRVHDEHPDQETAVLGQVLQSPELTDSVFLQVWDPFRFDAFTGLETLPYYLFWACQVSFKTAFMRDAGLFREHRGRGGAAAHEDAELGYRLHQAGMRLRYAPEALGYHYHVETLEGAMRRGYERGLNFGEFHAYVPEPEIVVRYHVLQPSTLADHVRAFGAAHRRYLLGADRSPLLLMLRYVARSIVFNGFTANFLWLPLTRAAEEASWAERLMHRDLYRGLISWQFTCGTRDAKSLYQTGKAQPSALS